MSRSHWDSGTSWDPAPASSMGMGRRGASLLASPLRAAGAVFLAIVAVVVAWHLVGWLIGAVFVAVKIAVLVGVIAALFAGARAISRR